MVVRGCGSWIVSRLDTKLYISKRVIFADMMTIRSTVDCRRTVIPGTIETFIRGGRRNDGFIFSFIYVGLYWLIPSFSQEQHYI